MQGRRLAHPFLCQPTRREAPALAPTSSQPATRNSQLATRLRLLVFSNCELDHRLGSGRTRLAWSAGLRERGHAVDIVDTAALLGHDGTRPGRRARIGWRGLRWLTGHDLSGYDLIEFYGAEFWPGTWWLSRRSPAKRPLLVAHTDGLELLGAERAAQATGGSPRPAGLRSRVTTLLQRAETLAFSRPDGFVTGCEADRRYMLAHRLGHPARLEVIPPGLEPVFLERPSPVGTRENRVAFLGSWIARKGTAPLLAAAVPLLRGRPDLQLDLLGVGETAETVLAAFPAELHPRLHVEPRLAVPEIIARLSRATVFFLPTEYEGFGLALAEAMACGCAAVTTPTGFGAELRDGEEAMVCPFGAAETMRAAVARLLDDDALRLRVAEAGWRRVQGLRWETSVGKLEATYLRWLDEKA